MKLFSTVLTCAAVTGVVALPFALHQPGPPQPPAAAAAAPSGRPAPHVHPFATKLRAPKPKRARQEKVSVPPYIDGCDHGYGKPHQCVPWHFPKLAKGQTKCDWLRAHNLGNVSVNNPRDRHGLDPKRTGKACGD